MNWENLKERSCPKCFAKIQITLLSGMVTCTNKNCTFKISELKFNQILSDRLRPYSKRRKTDDNLAELNNLNTEEITEDFSDSPYAERS